MTDEHLELLALCAVPDCDWYLIAREAQRQGGVEPLLRGEIVEDSRPAHAARSLIRDAASSHGAARERARLALRQADEAGAQLLTVLDRDYPHNLRLVFNLPPFLFYRGTLDPSDAYAVAVVGTRNASEEGTSRARKMARLLSENDVTVVSGLARGIDTAAQEATLAAGGRTIAVVGTGILRTYPPENAALAERISANGAIVSQFWPDAPPARANFPRRNITMSGITQGTVVIEAGSTSGAKMQARLALQHGKSVFLVRSLVSQPWARRYLSQGAVEVDDVSDVLTRLHSAQRIEEQASGRRQLSMQLTA